MTYKGFIMQEHLLVMMGGGGNVEWCPDFYTGPGPECMSYTEADDKGFFGEVPNTQLITTSNLTSQLGVTQGIAQNLNVPWLKFWLDGRILYVAKKTIRHSISYNHLRDKGIIDGSKIITINGLQYRVGLLSGIDDGYDGNVSAGFNQPYSMRSEWTRLMYNVSAEISDARYHKQGQIGDNWVEYPQDDSPNGLNITAGNGRFNWSRDLNPTNSTQVVLRGSASVVNMFMHASSSANTNYGWRPVLELIQY